MAGWVRNFLILDVVIYIFLLLIFPGLWPNGEIFISIAIGTIVSYLIYEKLLKNKEDNWRKPGEILVAVNFGLNAIFCIIIIAAIVIGLFNAARSF